MAITHTRDTTETTTEKGISLARGPALALGTILLAAGLYFIYKAHYFPPFSNFPNGSAPDDTKVFGLFGANGWTGMLTAVAGGLLLFGAAQHLLAKTMSLIVGIALGAAAVIALISGDVLGLAAANGWTELAWGIASAILLVNTLVPRRRRTVAVVDTAPQTTAVADRDTRVDRSGRYADEPATEVREDGDERYADDPAAERDAGYTDDPADERSRARYADDPAAEHEAGYTDDSPAEREARHADDRAGEDEAPYVDHSGANPR